MAGPLSHCAAVLCAVRLCETAGREGAALVPEWSRLSRQISQRPAAERAPRNRLHRVHGPRDLAPRSLQRWTQPGASVAPQLPHRWGELLQYLYCYEMMHIVCVHFYLFEVIRTCPRVFWNSLTFEENFSYHQSELDRVVTKLLERAWKAPVIMTTFPNCCSSQWHTRMTA